MMGRGAGMGGMAQGWKLAAVAMTDVGGPCA
jgi:hypothetical protein